ncbi:MAG TPA: Ig-like domain-containing protein, partial [Chthoniobacteraceae bacterium]
MFATRLAANLAALSLALSSASAAEGPGVPNIAYDPSRTGEVLSKVDPQKAISAILLHRGYLFVPMGADHGGGQGVGAFAFYDASNPSAPRSIFDSRNSTSRYHTPGTLDYVGDWAEQHHIPVSGSLSLISERRSSSAGFVIFDLAPLYDDDSQTHPRTISRYSYPGVTSPSNYDGYSFAPAWQGQRYVYAPTGANGLFVVDTADLQNLVLLAHRSRSQLGNLTLRQAIPIGNLMILATTALESTFDAVFMDISDPANPVQISTLRGPQGYQGFVYGSAFYGGGTPLQRHDFTNPANVVTTTMNAAPNFDRPEYGFGQDGYLFIGHDPGATKWRLNANTADFVSRVDSGVNDNHAFITPLGNLIAVTSDHNNDRKLLIGIHGPDKDVTGPVPLYVSPVNGKTSAHRLSRVGISFSDTIDPLTINSSTMIVREFGSATAIPGTYSTMVGIVNFVPNAPLAPDTTYEVVLTAGGVKDQSGNGVPAEMVVSQFSTGGSIHTYVTKINSPTPALVGTQVELSFTVSGGVGQQLEHSWDFGDDTPQTPFSTASSASHTYTIAGNHSVTVRTREVGGSSVTAVTATQVIHLLINPTPPLASSTIIVDPSQPLVWNVNPDNDSVTAIHVTDFQRVHEVPVGKNPRTLAFGPANSLWVVNKESATLSVINRATGAVSATHQLPSGSAPHGIVIHSGVAYVSLEATGQVAKIDTATGAVLATAAVGAWPRALALDPTTQLLWVARFISPDGAGVVSKIDLASFTPFAGSTLAVVQEPDSLTNGRGLPNYLGALAISPDLTQLYIPAKKDNIFRGGVRDGLPLTFETTVRSMGANVDLRTGLENSARRLDLDNSDFASAVAFSPLGNLAFFTTSGSTTVWAVDAYRPSNSFTFSSGGLAPDGLAFNAA